jgi:hypothetical protein
MDEDKKGPYILHSEEEKDIREVNDRKGTGDDNVPGDLLS